MTNKDIISQLEGEMIKEIFKEAEGIAELHNTITSCRGDYFRRRLLQVLEVEREVSQLEELREGADLRELHRHLNKLLTFNLIRTVQEKAGEKYERTQLGEKAINILRALEQRIGKEEATKIYEAALGPNSVRLFLRIYSQKKEPDLEKLDVRYTPSEIGKLCLFLSRRIEGIAAIDKLSDAALLIYQEDGYIHMPPKKARSFYQYLQQLYKIVKSLSETIRP
jgi:hypothetical protein